MKVILVISLNQGPFSGYPKEEGAPYKKDLKRSQAQRPSELLDNFRV